MEFYSRVIEGVNHRFCLLGVILCSLPSRCENNLTILGSDLGQVGNPSPVDGFRGVINICLELGYEENEIRKLISENASKLIGI